MPQRDPFTFWCKHLVSQVPTSGSQLLLGYRTGKGRKVGRVKTMTTGWALPPAVRAVSSFKGDAPKRTGPQFWTPDFFGGMPNSSSFDRKTTPERTDFSGGHPIVRGIPRKVQKGHPLVFALLVDPTAIVCAGSMQDAHMCVEEIPRIPNLDSSLGPGLFLFIF